MSAPGEVVWFIGPWDRPGYYLRRSDMPGRSRNDEGDGSNHRPPNFPWKSMDRRWSASYKPQGTACVDHLHAWSVLSVADYTIDSRPNVLVAFAIERPDMPLLELATLAAERYPTIWARLGVGDEPGGKK